MSLQAIALALLVGLAGCAVGPNYRRPDVPVPPVFAATASPATAPTAAVAPDLAAWWHALGDPELDSLVARAVRMNPDLDIALTRLQQARTYEAVVLGYALPEADASAAAGRGTGTDLTRGRAESGLVSADNTNGLQHINTIAGFDAVWELDVFGKYRREIEAARYDRQAAAAARNAVLTSVVADVVRAYVDLRGFQTQVAILRKASEVLRESLRLVTIRYERGITNELDVTLAARELATLEAQISPVSAQASAAQFALATLVGEYPETLATELAEPHPIPSMPGPAQAGVPVDLLKRRPDIQQAERELAGATARIGVATANLFPQIALVGAIGSQGQGWGTTPVVSKHVWSFGPGAIWPLLDFGALDAQVDIADLEAHARLTIYRRTILNAVQEVDTALSAYTAQQDRLDHLGEGMIAGERAITLASERYERGLTDFLNVVDAERQFYDLQEQYVTAQVGAAEQFVQLYKSLGGGWENYQVIPAIRRPEPAVIAAFQRVLTGSSP
ncbi:MAG TPA: efflux transporter outer membrane subunit [Steroidobacteraceae bacterium]|nr:efflux transporter outer membrane subunit [Steroidobacteraceae bacterium]